MNILEMNHVKKHFGDLEVLKDINLSVSEGQVVSIIGRRVRESQLFSDAPLFWKQWITEI